MTKIADISPRRLIAVMSVLLLLVTLTSARAQPTEQRTALVIGNSNYLKVNKLRNPTHDAKAMADMLRRIGFVVIEQEDVTRHDLVQAARLFSEKLAPGGVGVFYYAGHGVQNQGINYLIPTDASVSVVDDLRYEAFDVQDILDRLAESRVRLSLVILDACRDNPFGKSFRSVGRGLARIDPARGTILAYATAPGQVAEDGDGNNGIYTSELLKAIAEPGKKLQDVFETVTEAVERRTQNRQTPWINSSFRGDFYFVGPTTVTITPPDLPAVLASAEIVFWQSIVNSTNPADYQAYLKNYPHGKFAILAQLRLDGLTKPLPNRKAPDTAPPADTSPSVTAPSAVPPTAAAPSAAPPPPTPPSIAIVPSLAAPDTSPPVATSPPMATPPAGAGLTAKQTPEQNSAADHPAEQATGSTAAKPLTPPSVPPKQRLAEAKPPVRLPTSPPRPSPALASPPPVSAATPSTAPRTLEATARPDSPAPPAVSADTPAPSSPAETPLAERAKNCIIPPFTGISTGAGGYATIRVVNNGQRCGRHVYYTGQNLQYNFTLRNPPRHGTVTIEPNAFYYTPEQGYAGSDEFSLASSNGGGVRAVVTVVPPNLSSQAR